MEPQVLLAMGDAYYGDKKSNSAFYRNAYQADASLIRAKMQLGVLPAVKAYNDSCC
jgi:hypothetical protein